MIRIQLDLPDDRVKELDAYMSETGIATRKELFNTALSLFEWAIREKRLGRAIASIDDEAKKVKEVVMPPLEAVSAKAGKAAKISG